jgi:hypothetical protein
MVTKLVNLRLARAYWARRSLATRGSLYSAETASAIPCQSGASFIECKKLDYLLRGYYLG